MTNIGLSLIITAWVIQYLSKGKNLKPSFVMVYVLGVSVLAIGGYLSGLTTMAALNIISAVTALAVYLKNK